MSPAAPERKNATGSASGGSIHRDDITLGHCALTRAPFPEDLIHETCLDGFRHRRHVVRGSRRATARARATAPVAGGGGGTVPAQPRGVRPDVQPGQELGTL